MKIVFSNAVSFVVNKSHRFPDLVSSQEVPEHCALYVLPCCAPAKGDPKSSCCALIPGGRLLHDVCIADSRVHHSRFVTRTAYCFPSRFISNRIFVRLFHQMIRVKTCNMGLFALLCLTRIRGIVINIIKMSSIRSFVRQAWNGKEYRGQACGWISIILKIMGFEIVFGLRRLCRDAFSERIFCVIFLLNGFDRK